jgi:glycopeptide antibiotics resistance protein
MLKFTPVGLAAIVLYLVLAVVFGVRKRPPLQRQVLSLVFFVYVLTVMSVTLFPLPIQKRLIEDAMTYHWGWGTNNFIPLKTILNLVLHDPFPMDAVRNISGNIVLFIPLGFLVPLVRRRDTRFGKVVAFGFCASLVVELSQLVISSIIGFTYRAFDVDDLILNTIGVAVGYLLFSRFQSIVQNRGRSVIR